jgi:hypothetical protein
VVKEKEVKAILKSQGTLFYGHQNGKASRRLIADSRVPKHRTNHINTVPGKAANGRCMREFHCGQMQDHP